MVNGELRGYSVMHCAMRLEAVGWWRLLRIEAVVNIMFCVAHSSCQSH